MFCKFRTSQKMSSIFNFMFTENTLLSVPLGHGIPPLSPKTTNRTSLLVEDLSVSGKALGMDQN